MHQILAKAVCFHEALQPEFKTYSKNVVRNAQALAEALMVRGRTVVSGGTDNHLLLLDLRNTGVNGKQAQEALDAVRLSTNKNMLPFDPLPPTQTSGIRLGTPAPTTRGMGLPEMDLIAGWVDRRLQAPDDEAEGARIREEISDITSRFPIPALADAVAA